MEIDARALPDGTTLEAAVCVVGAGPAGISVARTLAAEGVDVVLLESGGLVADAAAQDLNDGGVTGPYAGPRTTRHRQVGGTPHLWNTVAEGRSGWARHLPLDPEDFAVGAADGWPFGREHLDPWYRRAQALCGVEGGWDAPGLAAPGRPPIPFPPGTLVTGIYRFGEGEPWTRGYVCELRASRNVRLVHSGTVLPLAVGPGQRVGRVDVAGPASRFTVRADAVVLACGAIETARLLLAGPAGSPWMEHGQVGLHFSEHPRDYALRLQPATPGLFGQAAFFDAHRAPDGGLVGGRLGPSAEARAEGWPNFGITLLPWTGGSVVQRLRSRLRGKPVPQPGYGWSTAGRAYAGFRLVVNLEQRDDPARRVELGRERDPHGVPRSVVHWHWSREEQGGLERLRERLSDWFAAAGVGRLEWRPGTPPDPNAHHHAGTARMHPDPRSGVVDADGRVHGVENLYVVGGATFPRSGFANPVLTVVAMALRLAGHLVGRTA